jgi:DnaJ-class molecular chaperone
LTLTTFASRLFGLEDPYKVLGVSRDATAEQIKSAYRKLARGLHPDLHPNDKQAEDKFKKVGAAYDLLGDAKKKARFDAGEIDASGAERARARARSGAGAGSTGGGGFGFGFGGGGGNPFGDSAQDIFDELLRRRDKSKSKGWSPFDDQPGVAPGTGGDAHFSLKITFAEAALGATKRITLTSGKNLDVKVPPGAKDASTLRLKGQGHAGRGGGPAGDALIEIKVESHPFFVRQGDDITITVPVTLGEAVGGAKITVPTVDGKVALTIPPGANSGTTLRLKGKGIGAAGARGDQLVSLKVMLPDRADDELAEFLKKWESKHPYDVRKKEGMD